MEKVIVVKRIPGILEIGDVLTSDAFGHDFILEQKKRSAASTSERYVNLDYYTVSGNIPEYFDFVIDEGEYEKFDFNIIRSAEELEKRYNYFVEQMNIASTGSEQETVYANLVWFIEWLTGLKELVRA